jgi:hypothetical protein
MATPETRSVELDPFAPSVDGAPNALEREECRVVEPDTRELSAYGFDSDDKTLAGMGTSGSTDASTVSHIDSNDRTLVGIGPVEQAQLAELASHSQHAEPAPESVPMPHSEPPGPFVASDDRGDAPDRLPKQRGEPSLLALGTALLAAAAVALLRGGVPHSTAPHLHSATTFALLPMASATRTRYVQPETAAGTSADKSMVEIHIPQAPQPASPPATMPATATTTTTTTTTTTATATATQRETQPELAPRRASTKTADSVPLGVLEVTSSPITGVVLDGRPLGKAPRVVQLPSGLHTVLFVHSERGRMSVTVNVRPGRTTSASADF